VTTIQALRKENARLRQQIAEEKRHRKQDAENAAAREQALRQQMRELEVVVKQLTATVENLKAQLARNSSNSSTPPSQDPPSGVAPKSLRRRSGRKPGGQFGHKGATLELVDNPDEVVEHSPVECSKCGRSLEDSPVVDKKRRQVVDTPPIRPVVVEHQLNTKQCSGCGAKNTPVAPAGVEARTQYGPNVLALMVYLYQRHFLSLKRTAELLGDVMGTPVSEATVLKANLQAAGVVNQRFAPAAKRALAAGGVLHVDETSVKQDGKKIWLHSASNKWWVWITAHRKRGREATDVGGVVPNFTATLVHDCWAPYDSYEQVTAHQLCCAHLLRELQSVTDWFERTHQPGEWCWATQVADAIRQVIADPAKGPQTRRLVMDASSVALRDNPALANQWPDGKLGSKYRALARRVKHRIDDYLRFTLEPETPPTNNAAEQEIRVAKTRTKISGTMRTMKGAQAFASITAYLSTARKHGQHPLAVLASLTSPNPWIPATP
jgi:transposase